jgi:hypothetical protein
MRILKFVTVLSFVAIAILIAVSAPAHSLIPDRMIGDLAFIFCASPPWLSVDLVRRRPLPHPSQGHVQMKSLG